MLKALDYLKKELNVIHRDVKPSNILLSRNGSVKICDFGISGRLENSIAKSNVGTKNYLAVSFDVLASVGFANVAYVGPTVFHRRFCQISRVSLQISVAYCRKDVKLAANHGILFLYKLS